MYGILKLVEPPMSRHASMLDLDVATDAARRMGEACLDVLRRIAPSDVLDV